MTHRFLSFDFIRSCSATSKYFSSRDIIVTEFNNGLVIIYTVLLG